MEDPFDLQRFVDAQEPVIDRVRVELRAGRKASHWMWFIFPQVAGLGRSPMAQHYAISSLAEAQAYLDHSLLGTRLRDCTRLVLDIKDRTSHQIFGSLDDVKFRSSMTLFAQVDLTGLFDQALTQFCGGEPDPATLEQLSKREGR
ncbi:MAG: DUF1810 domain-containing protein [Pseudomonadota bacterium]